jgi:protocatechuate 3,4-dioxygenase beta subunit
MRIEDFPRPPDDNRRGIHWSASVYHPGGKALEPWIAELQALHVKWVKLLDDGSGSSLELCERLLDARMMPIVRLYRQRPNPAGIGSRELATVRRLVAAGVRYFETNSEPDIPAEWQESYLQGGNLPPDWLDAVAESFIHDADAILGLGGLPAFPALHMMSGAATTGNPLAHVTDRGRADLFERGAWLAIHNAPLNRPLDYPYDPVNQTGAALDQDAYDRLGAWAWDGQSREAINRRRAEARQPGATPADDPACFLAFRLAEQWAREATGHAIPLISTEGGPVMGNRGDVRYPRLTPQLHADGVVAVNEFLQGSRLLGGEPCPDYYLAVCHWLLGNARLGFFDASWEGQAWYTDWWNSLFGLAGRLPVVDAVKAMPARGMRRVSHDVSALPPLPVPPRRASGARTGSVAMRDASLDARGGAMNDTSNDGKSTLSGTLVNPAGAAKPGVPITLARDGAPVDQLATGPDGGFRFAALPAGVYQLVAPGITVTGIALDGSAGKTIKLTAGAAAAYRYTVASCRLLSESETAGRSAFYGTVTDADGRPLNGIRIQMAWAKADPSTTFPTTVTGKDPYRPAGLYEFVHTQGVFRLQVMQGDWPSDVADDLDTKTVPDRAGKPITYEVNFQLKPANTPSSIQGLAPDGGEGRKATLTALDAQGTSNGEVRETALGAGGAFAFDGIPAGDYRLELSGVGSIASQIHLDPGSLYMLLFPSRSRLQGQVVGATPGLTAILYPPAPWDWTRQCPLDPEGRFSFEDLPAGRYRVQVGSQSVNGLALTGENTLQVTPIDLLAGRRGAVSGVIADAAGQPQANVAMTLRREGQTVAQVTTGADGRYRFGNLPAGIYSLEAGDMGTVAEAISLDGTAEETQNVVWSQPAARATLEGRVLDAGGSPQPGVPVRLLQNGAPAGATQTDDTGTYRFAGFPPGDYTLTAGEAAAPTLNVTLRAGFTSYQDVTLPPGAPKPVAHYLLFAAPAGARARLALALALPYLLQTGATAGFSLGEAAQAAQVTIVGDETPAEAEETLQAAGCRIGRLSGDAVALALAFRGLLAG